MARRSDTYTSGFLKAKDMLDQGFANGLDLTIKSMSGATMDDGTKQRVVAFNEDERELGLNATNWDKIADLTGKDDDDDWSGFVINVYPHHRAVLLQRDHQHQRLHRRAHVGLPQPRRGTARDHPGRRSRPRSRRGITPTGQSQPRPTASSNCPTSLAT